MNHYLDCGDSFTGGNVSDSIKLYTLNICNKCPVYLNKAILVSEEGMISQRKLRQNNLVTGEGQHMASRARLCGFLRWFHYLLFMLDIINNIIMDIFEHKILKHILDNFFMINSYMLLNRSVPWFFHL